MVKIWLNSEWLFWWSCRTLSWIESWRWVWWVFWKRCCEIPTCSLRRGKPLQTYWSRSLLHYIICLAYFLKPMKTFLEIFCFVERKFFSPIWLHHTMCSLISVDVHNAFIHLSLKPLNTGSTQVCAVCTKAQRLSHCLLNAASFTWVSFFGLSLVTLFADQLSPMTHAAYSLPTACERGYQATTPLNIVQTYWPF